MLKDFRLEYAKSGASKCGVCEEKIAKVRICQPNEIVFHFALFQAEVRVGKKEYESQRAKMYGPYDKWHHIKCFVQKRDELEFFDSGCDMGGFKTLSPEDQDMIKSSIKAVKRKKEGKKPNLC